MTSRHLSTSLALWALVFLVCIGCGGGSGNSSGGGPGGGGTGDLNPVPALTSVSPNRTGAGSPGITVTLTGSNFISNSEVVWNSTKLNTTYVSPTSLTAYLPPSVVAVAGAETLTVVNPAPGGGTSAGVQFTVGATTLTTATVPVIANDIAWDPVNQRLYLSLIGSTMTNGTSIQSLDPTTGTLGTPVSVGAAPDRLAVSANSKYLYVALDDGYTPPGWTSTVAGGFVMPVSLPGLVKGNVFFLGFDPKGIDGSYFAMEIAPSPGSDDTVAVVRGSTSVAPAEVGGVVI